MSGMKILVIGGNRYFGKKMVSRLIADGNDVTVLNRQSVDDGFTDRVHRIKCDRTDQAAMTAALGRQEWDLVYDQVCFEAQDARAAIEIFTPRTARYIFTSSQSVYGPGAKLREQDFDPTTHVFTKDAKREGDYAEAKRQCEAVFFSQSELPVTAIRFPIVVGPDDYTKRLKWHVDRIRAGEEMFFPNIHAKLSLIHSDDAAAILSHLASDAVQGPLNVCADQPIELAVLVKTIEAATNGAVVLAKAANETNQSPFGVESDWYMSTERLLSIGLQAAPISSWLPELSRRVCELR